MKATRFCRGCGGPPRDGRRIPLWRCTGPAANGRRSSRPGHAGAPLAPADPRRDSAYWGCKRAPGGGRGRQVWQGARLRRATQAEHGKATIACDEADGEDSLDRVDRPAGTGRRGRAAEPSRRHPSPWGLMRYRCASSGPYGLHGPYGQVVAVSRCGTRGRARIMSPLLYPVELRPPGARKSTSGADLGRAGALRAGGRGSG